MKKNIIQTFKIITLGLVLSASFALAQIWVLPGGNPPTSGSISAPINTSINNQVKSGALGTGPLSVFGLSEFYGKQSVLTSGNLFVSNKMGVGLDMTNPTRDLEIVNENNPNDVNNPFSGNINTTSLKHLSDSYLLREVCSNSSGVLVLCPVPTPTPIPPISPNSKTWVVPGTFSFTIPYGATSITIETWGGGGGGGGGQRSNGTQSSGGNGSGGYGGSYHSDTYSVPGNISSSAVLSVNVGGGGAGGSGQAYDDSSPASFGSNGGNSSVLKQGTSLSTAAGGSGGITPGVGSFFDGYPGTNGGAGGAAGAGPGCNSAGNAGNSGSAPGGGGGGGSGGRQCASTGKHSGGSGGYGASGQVKISWQ